MSMIDLDQIAATVEQYMPDRIIIRRKIGVVMDSVTMKETIVYQTIYDGKAFVSPMGDPAGTLRASENVYRVQYEVGIPRESPEIKPNDEVVVMESADPSFQDLEPIYVHDIISGTFFTHRRIKGFRDRSSV